MLMIIWASQKFHTLLVALENKLQFLKLLNILQPQEPVISLPHSQLFMQDKRVGNKCQQKNMYMNVQSCFICNKPQTGNISNMYQQI